MQQRQQFFAHKTSKKGNIVCFWFLKKIEIALITLFTILLISHKYFIRDVCLGSKYTSDIQTFEMKTQPNFISWQIKLLAKTFYQSNLIAPQHLYVFVESYFLCLFRFSWISGLEHVPVSSVLQNQIPYLHICSCISTCVLNKVT